MMKRRIAEEERKCRLKEGGEAGVWGTTKARSREEDRLVRVVEIDVSALLGFGRRSLGRLSRRRSRQIVEVYRAVVYRNVDRS
jgi:hypothetical protein